MDEQVICGGKRVAPSTAIVCCLARLEAGNEWWERSAHAPRRTSAVVSTEAGRVTSVDSEGENGS